MIDVGGAVVSDPQRRTANEVHAELGRDVNTHTLDDWGVVAWFKGTLAIHPRTLLRELSSWP